MRTLGHTGGEKYATSSPKIRTSNYIFCSHTYSALEWDKKNRDLLNNQYSQLLPHLHGALYFGILLRMGPSTDVWRFSNLTYTLSFCNTPSYFYNLIRIVYSYFLSSLKSVTVLSQKINIRTPKCWDRKAKSYMFLIYKARSSVRDSLCWAYCFAPLRFKRSADIEYRFLYPTDTRLSIAYRSSWQRDIQQWRHFRFHDSKLLKK
jgi:hypothetical protein